MFDSTTSSREVGELLLLSYGVKGAIGIARVEGGWVLVLVPVNQPFGSRGKFVPAVARIFQPPPCLLFTNYLFKTGKDVFKCFYWVFRQKDQI
ncbi:MAG: hypothetical protein A2W62_03485 [Alphaproteobacteria bacterium RIFCSPLOWO2_02_42_7]|nr:MAG: hypothetical protein A2W62_03485 [Alphaproteobacteria bacterium RIFCSPLOWO2_02_42_7]